MIRCWLLPFVVLGGCAALPTAGPTASDVIDRQQASGDAVRRYDVLDVDEQVVEVLRNRRPASFYARFGDYRAPASPRLDIGDTVSLTIWETSSNGLFSSPTSQDHSRTGAKSATMPDQAVGRDGSISVPYAGRIRVAGLSALRVQQKVEEALKGKAIQPQVLVSVTRPIGNTVTVTGEVGAAARVPLSNKGDRLLDVLAGAGGPRIAVDDASVQLSRGSATLSVPLSRVIATPRENVFMRPGDTLTIVRRPETFMAFGASGRNEELPFGTDKLTLSQAMAKMGGLLDNRADPAGIFVFRYEPTDVSEPLLAKDGGMPKKPMVYRLNLRDPNTMLLAQQFPIFDKDVVYISDAPITDVHKVMAVIGSAISPAARIAVSTF